jgi:site-specific recombinase XerD
MSPVTLSRGLELVERLKSRGSYKPHWYSRPVELLIQQLGDIPIADVTEDDIFNWYETLSKSRNERTGNLLSPYTINSYSRALRAYFSHLVRMGHLAETPAKKLKLPALPVTSKNAIPDDDLEKIIMASKMHTRDYAIVLILRDSGCRVGELVSMTTGNISIERYYIEQVEGEQFGEFGSFRKKQIVLIPEDAPDPQGVKVRLRGRAMVLDTKTRRYRILIFHHDACIALQMYMDARPVTDHNSLWVNERTYAPLSADGVRLMLKRLKHRSGARICNPHAFRHRLAKKLKENRVDPEIIARILGHQDTATYQAVYGTTTEDEIVDYHTMYVEN